MYNVNKLFHYPKIYSELNERSKKQTEIVSFFKILIKTKIQT